MKFLIFCFQNFSTVVNKNKNKLSILSIDRYYLKKKEKDELKRETTWWIFGEKSTDRNCGHERSTTVNRCTPVSCSVVCEAYKRKIEGFAAAPVEALYRGYQRGMKLNSTECGSSWHPSFRGHPTANDDIDAHKHPPLRHHRRRHWLYFRESHGTDYFRIIDQSYK